MTDKPAPPRFDASAYTKVVIVKSDEVDGHLYRRGSRHSVDAATLAALKAKGMVTV